MAKEPDDRYATCADAVAEAEAALGLARPPRSRRRRALLALAALAVTAALAVAAAASLGMNGGAARGGPLEVERNSLVRVDPQTSKVTAVVAVGQYPQAAAVFGRTVWVYNLGDSVVAQIDAVTNEVVHKTDVSTTPSGGEESSVFAADAGGAWLVGFRPDDGRSLLTRILRDGGGKQEIDLGVSVDEVMAAAGSVWVLGHRGARHVLIRVDPGTGTAVRRLWLSPSAISPSIAGLSLGGGYAWVRNEDAGVLYRIDLRTGAVRARDLGVLILRPVFGFGRVWACVADGDSASMMRIDPRTMRDTFSGRGLPGEEGTYAVGLDSVWRHDVSTGTLMRFDASTGALLRLIRILRAPGTATVTSIAAGADAVWVAVS
jgi:streptogramin lyase